MSAADTFRASPEGYDRLMGRYSIRLAGGLADRAGVRDGMTALDVGCGPGALTTTLVARLGAGSVAAADPSEPFAAACRERLPGVEVAVAPAEALPFDDDRFDVTLSQLVMNFMADPEAGVREMGRVTRPGGTVAACVWDYGDAMTLLRAFWDAAREVAGEDAARADEGARMRFCREGELAALWRRAGLRDVQDGEMVVHADYTGFDDLWSAFLAGVGPAGAFCMSLEQARRDRLRTVLREALGVGDEPFALPARAWTAVGSVPR